MTEAQFTAHHADSGARFTAAFGRVQELNSWKLAHLLRSECAARERLTHSGNAAWEFTNLRRIEYIPAFAVARGSQSVLAALELTEQLIDLFTSQGTRQCPHCKTLIPVVTLPQAVQRIIDAHDGLELPFGTALKQLSVNPIDRGFLYGLRDNQRVDLDQSDSLFIDRFLICDQNRTRISEAIMLARDLGAYQIEVGASIYPISNQCVTCGYAALPLNRTVLQGNPYDSECLSSYLYQQTSLWEVLNQPLGECAYPPLQALSNLIGDNEIRLIDTASQLAPPARQLVRILKVLLQEQTEFIVIIEEPFRRAAIAALLERIADNHNSVLLLCDQSAEYPLPTYSTDTKANLDQMVQATLPTLAMLSESHKSVAEECQLKDALVEFYQSLPLSKMHGLSAEQILHPTPATPVPIFKSLSFGQVLTLSANQAHLLLAHIPACAQRLSLLKSLGVGEVRLDTPIHDLTLGEKNLLRLSHLNPRAGKRPRLYQIEYPFVGLSKQSCARVSVLFEQLLKNQNALILSGDTC